MNFLEKKNLIYRCEELVSAEELINENVLILYYFTSADCYACRTFDEKLENVCSEAKNRNVEMLVIVVSMDDDMEKMTNGLQQHYSNYYAVPFRDELRSILRINYGVTHIPFLIVVRGNGEIVTRRGRSEIENIGINVLITWPE